MFIKIIQEAKINIKNTDHHTVFFTKQRINMWHSKYYHANMWLGMSPGTVLSLCDAAPFEK